MELLKINQIDKESLKIGGSHWTFYTRGIAKAWVQKLSELAKQQGGEEAWKSNGCFAFMVTFLGLIVFPKWDKHIDIRLAGVVKRLPKWKVQLLFLLS